MKQLWAPWRAVYLEKIIQEKGCFICRAIKSGRACPPKLQRRRDKKNLVLVRGPKCLVIMNRYPYNSGHLLVAPLAHKSRMEQLTAAEVQEIFGLLCLMKKKLELVLKPQGFNIGVNLGRVAGAGLLGHIHFHLVPRWKGDTNFMSIASDTRVISQSLTKLYLVLKKSLRKT